MTAEDAGSAGIQRTTPLCENPESPDSQREELGGTPIPRAPPTLPFLSGNCEVLVSDPLLKTAHEPLRQRRGSNRSFRGVNSRSLAKWAFLSACHPSQGKHHGQSSWARRGGLRGPWADPSELALAKTAPPACHNPPPCSREGQPIPGQYQALSILSSRLAAFMLGSSPAVGGWRMLPGGVGLLSEMEGGLDEEAPPLLDSADESSDDDMCDPCEGPQQPSSTRPALRTNTLFESSLFQPHRRRQPGPRGPAAAVRVGAAAGPALLASEVEGMAARLEQLLRSPPTELSGDAALRSNLQEAACLLSAGARQLLQAALPP